MHVTLRDTKAPTNTVGSAIQEPSFGSAVIQGGRSDGYWVETFHFDKDDKVPGVMTSGLVSGLIEFLDNPIAESQHKSKTVCSSCTEGAEDKPSLEQPWTRYEIGKYNSPVAIVAVDITGNGLMDLVICHDYGPFMLECDPKGGHVTWLENPGRKNLKTQGHWKERYIGRWPAMHRIRAGHFTQKSFLEIIAASVVYGPHDKTTPIPIIRFQAPEKVLEAAEWQRDIIDDKNYTCIHEVMPRKLDGPDGLESLIVSSREGTTVLSYDTLERTWNRTVIGIGEPKEMRQKPDSESPGSGDHWGTGCADIGKVGNDPYAYIATLDPFHGIAACVYTKVDSSLYGQTKWERHVLDVYGTPNQRLKTGDGPGHYIVCADFDGDGDDEFLLSLFGPLDRDDEGESVAPPSGPHPYKGIMYYKPIDIKKGIFAKWKVAEESSARIAIGDFGGSGRLDLISMGYNVKRYYEEPEPVVTLHLNDFAPAQPKDASQSAIFTTYWDNEGMVYLLNPSIAKNKVTEPSIAHLIEIANYAVSVEVYPPSYDLSVGSQEGIKVLYGSVDLIKEDGSVAGTRQPFSVPEFSAATTTFSYGKGKTDKKLGAVLLRMRPLFSKKVSSSGGKGYPAAKDVPVKTMLSLPSPLPSTLPQLEFNKVDSLWWGEPFKDMDFYNLSGFHFQFFNPNASPSHVSLGHIQFWTAGYKVNCGVHNHSQDIFCEMHVCLSPGTGNGGMARLKPQYAKTVPPERYNSLGNEAFDSLPLKELEEHGGIWERDSEGRPVRKGASGVIKYPYHKWQAGDEAKDVDVWMAIEFNPEVVDQAVNDGQKVALPHTETERVIRRGGGPAKAKDHEWEDLVDTVMI